MNREMLDAFFAQAEDVLDNWNGGADAMNTAAPSETFLRFLETVEPGPGYEHLRLLGAAYRHAGDEWLYDGDLLSAMRHTPVVNPRSLLLVADVS